MTSIRAPIQEITTSLYGAFRLACGDTNGLNFFNVSQLGFWRSFTAAIIVAPIFIIVLNVRYLMGENDINIMRFICIYAITYVIGWVAFPLLVSYVVTLLNKSQKFICYIIAYNWASVPQNFIYLPFVILVEAGLLQGRFSVSIGLLLLVLIFFYIWFITKSALEVSSLVAAGIVILDLILSITISLITQSGLH